MMSFTKLTPKLRSPVELWVCFLDCANGLRQIAAQDVVLVCVFWPSGPTFIEERIAASHVFIKDGFDSGLKTGRTSEIYFAETRKPDI